MRHQVHIVDIVADAVGILRLRQAQTVALIIINIRQLHGLKIGMDDKDDRHALSLIQQASGLADTAMCRRNRPITSPEAAMRRGQARRRVAILAALLDGVRHKQCIRRRSAVENQIGEIMLVLKQPQKLIENILGVSARRECVRGFDQARLAMHAILGTDHDGIARNGAGQAVLARTGITKDRDDRGAGPGLLDDKFSHSPSPLKNK